MRYLMLPLFLIVILLNPAPAGPPSSVSAASPTAHPRAAAIESDHGRGTPMDRWKATAMAACERNRCDGWLLIAIGIVETNNDPRGPQTPHEDQKSYGRYGVLPSTAAFHLMGAKYTKMRNLMADDIITIIKVLSNEETGADLSARHLRWCMDRPWVRRSRNPRASAAHCWNPNDSAYPGKVMAEYRKLEEGR